MYSSTTLWHKMEKLYLGIALTLENSQEGTTPPSIINKYKNVLCARKEWAEMQMLSFPQGNH